MHGLDDGGATRSKLGEDLQISLKATRQFQRHLPADKQPLVSP